MAAGCEAMVGAPSTMISAATEVTRVTRLPELRKRYLERGIELTSSASADEFSAYIKAEFDKKAKLAREAGIRIE